MASVVPFTLSPSPFSYSKARLHFRVRVQSLGDTDSDVSFHSQKSRAERKWLKDDISKDLNVLWDDGYGTKTVKHYLEAAKDMINPDGGPPRWFCPVECSKPLNNSPLLLFLPGLDGLGLGLALQHKSVGKVFEVQCLHIPINDKTPFEGLVKLVEKTVRAEHATSPNKPIYIVGESFGGCVALTVAARNPNIDLVLVLVNPATSFGMSQIRHLVPFFEALHEGLYNGVPYLLSILMGNPLKMAMIDIDFTLPLCLKIEQLLANLTEFPKHAPDVFNTISKETILWKVKLLDSGAAIANSRLHDVKAEVLVIASGNDCILPSRDEAERLRNSLQNCTVRRFKDNGHLLLLEEGISLLTVIKATGKYRRSRRHDCVSDFVPPSKSEFTSLDRIFGFVKFASCHAMFSTMADGRIVRGLDGVSDEGPVIYVGNHMLMGVEVYTFFEEFMRQKNLPIHGTAHPVIFSGVLEKLLDELSLADWFRLMGAVPVTPANLVKLLLAKRHVLIYPGGPREALHDKGEEYKLKWPEQPEFVRMAARFGATIVPFGTIGEDDLMNLNLDYNDLTKIPFVNDVINDISTKFSRARNKGEVLSEKLFFPGFSPKILPGRMYSLFGKPIETKGKEELIKDREYAKEMYLHIQSEVRHNIDYLLRKREEDPYRNVVDRMLYRALYTPLSHIPAFDP